MINESIVNKAILGNKKAADICTSDGQLLPCPHCGLDAFIHYRDSYIIIYRKDEDTSAFTINEKNYFCYCKCNRCGSEITGKGENVEEAEIDARRKWNKRMELRGAIVEEVCSIFPQE